MPVFNRIQPLGNEAIRQVGGSLSKRCVGGPRSRWLKNGVDFTGIIPILNISPLAESNTGFYQCVVFDMTVPEFVVTDTAGIVYTLIQGTNKCMMCIN